MPLKLFIDTLIALLEENRISYCILRNYEGLPEINLGNDIDILVPLECRTSLKILLFQMPNIKVTSILERPQGMMVFVYGVGNGGKYQALEIDFIFSLSWKGIDFLDTHTVLQMAKPMDSTNLKIIVPTREHEAIISLFSSYLIGGWIKERYFESVRSTFKIYERQVTSTLGKFMGSTVAANVVTAVLADNRKELMAILPTIKGELLRRSFLRRPFDSCKRIIRHFSRELQIYFSQKHILSIGILGPDGAGKSTIIREMEPLLTNITKEIVVLHLKPKIFGSRLNSKIVTDPHALPVRSQIISICKVIIWCIEISIDKINHRHRNTTLRIWDRYFHDILIDPVRYRYGGPMPLINWIAKKIPQPTLWILLDAPTSVLQCRKQEVSAAETDRQRRKYISLMGTFNDGVIIDASNSKEKVANEIAQLIIEHARVKARKTLER